jgi:hypothetical protein
MGTQPSITHMFTSTVNGFIATAHATETETNIKKNPWFFVFGRCNVVTFDSLPR